MQCLQKGGASGGKKGRATKPGDIHREGVSRRWGGVRGGWGKEKQTGTERELSFIQGGGKGSQTMKMGRRDRETAKHETIARTTGYFPK